MMTNETDIRFMQQCFTLALKGSGKVSPNPLVGAVIVKNNRIISEGWHKEFGAAHAEAMAFSNTREDLKNGMLYCNLEPCCHTKKKTPPCLPLVINSGIKRVVLANTDPNPQVAGKSIQRMRKAGIEVVEGVLEDEGKELNRYFFKHITTQKPWVTVKIAQTLDGRISRSKSTQTWITGKESAHFVHQLRAQMDAVLVGAGTVKSDNPQLNVRHVKGRDPIKVILDGALSSYPAADLYSAGKTFLFHQSDQSFPKPVKNDKQEIAFFKNPDSDKPFVNLQFVLDTLGRHNINSLLVEGGQSIFSQFIEQNLADEIRILQAPFFLGEGPSATQLRQPRNYTIHRTELLGADYCMTLRKVNP